MTSRPFTCSSCRRSSGRHDSSSLLRLNFFSGPVGLTWPSVPLTKKNCHLICPPKQQTICQHTKGFFYMSVALTGSNVLLVGWLPMVLAICREAASDDTWAEPHNIRRKGGTERFLRKFGGLKTSWETQPHISLECGDVRWDFRSSTVPKCQFCSPSLSASGRCWANSLCALRHYRAVHRNTCLATGGNWRVQLK